MNQARSITAALTLALAFLAAPGFGADGKDRPADPFDYNFCGGERVYPIVGVNFSTACGPRNQVALGRRGKLMWLFPDANGGQGRQGSYQLDEKSLTTLSLLAEVASITPPPALAEAPVIYKLGINFSARQPRYMHAPLQETYTPANRLVQALLALVPDQPQLPACPGYSGVFDPTLHGPARREAHQANTRLSRNARE